IFCFNPKPPTQISPLSLHDALPILDCLLEIADHEQGAHAPIGLGRATEIFLGKRADDVPLRRVCVLRLVDEDMIGALVELVANRSEEHTSELQSLAYLVCRLLLEKK